MRYPLLAAAALLVTTALSCGGGQRPAAPVAPSSPGPATPSSPPTVTSVTVSGTAPTFGNVSHYTATATLSDASTQDVTVKATWESSNRLVVVVASEGIVTAAGAGEADIVATCDGTSGSAHVRVEAPTPRTYAIGGSVVDGSTNGVLPNILVRIVDGADAGKFAKTDERGAYAIGNIRPGMITLEASANSSYLTAVKSVAVSADTRVDFVLPRNLGGPPPPPPPPAGPVPPPTYTMIQCGGFVAFPGVRHSLSTSITDIYAVATPVPPVGTGIQWEATITNWPSTYGDTYGKTDASGTARNFPAWGVTGGLPVGSTITMIFSFIDRAQMGGSTCVKLFTVVP